MELKITECLITLEGLVTLLDAAAVYPATDPVAYQRMFGGLQILATKAERQLQEIEVTEAFKEAPAPEATGTSAKVKTNQVEVSTKAPVVSTETYNEIAAMCRKKIPLEDIAYKTKVPYHEVYRIRNEVI